MSSEGLRRGHHAQGRPRPTGFQAEALPQHHQHIQEAPCQPGPLAYTPHSTALGPTPPLGHSLGQSLPGPRSADRTSPGLGLDQVASALLADAFPLVVTVLTIEFSQRRGACARGSGPFCSVHSPSRSGHTRHCSCLPTALLFPGEHHLPIEASDPAGSSRSSRLQAAPALSLEHHSAHPLPRLPGPAPTAQGSVQGQDGRQQRLCPAQCGLRAVQQLSSPDSGPHGLWTQHPISPQPLLAGGSGERLGAWEVALGLS